MSKVEEALANMPLDAELEVQFIEYDPLGNPNSQNAIRRAELENLLVVFPSPYELFIDLDTEHSYQMFMRLFQIFQKFIDNDASYVENWSKSGAPKRHVAVSLSKAVDNEIQRVMFQVMLGSDRVRELLGYVQAVQGDPHPTLFLEAGPKALPPGPIWPQLMMGEITPVEHDIATDEDIPF